MRKILLNLNKLSKTTIITISFLLLILIGIIDYITGIELSIFILYLIPVIMCAWYVNRGAGLTLSISGTLIWYLTDFFSSRDYSHPIIPYWNSLVMFGIFLIISEIFTALKNATERENQLAVKVQMGLLPKEVPCFDSLQISVTWRPLGHVSGDYYDLVEFENQKLGFCIADVAGHGVPAALLMSNIQAGFHVTIQNDPLPSVVCKRLNHSIKHHQLSDKFISFFYGIIDLDKKSLIYSNAGHPPPLVIRQNGTVVQLSSGGTMLGIIPEYVCQHESIPLVDGDVIVLYTDGLTESKNLNEDLFGEENLIKICKANKHLDSHEIKNKVISAVNEFNSHLYDDDFTLVVLKYEV